MNRAAAFIQLIADGKLEAAGTHEELVAQPGRYAELFELQAAGYRQDDPLPTAAVPRKRRLR